MKNTVFGKTIDIFLENIKLVTTERRRNYLVSEPNYHTTNFFTKNASAIEMKKKTNKQKCLCDCNGTRTHNHLVRKQTLNHLAKLGK